MGITIRNTKGHHAHIGYGGFARLRMFVANACSKEYGAIYEKTYSSVFTHSLTDEQKKAFETEENNLIKQCLRTKEITPKIVKFLFESDCKGRISYGSCKDIIKKIENISCDDNFGYAMQPFTLQDFINLLQEVYDTKGALIWD